jgi:hypothetical protein
MSNADTAPQTRPEPHLPPAPRPPRPMSPLFFVWITTGLLFMAAAVFVWAFGPKIWPKAKPHAPAAAVSTAEPPSNAVLQARVAELQQELEDAHRAEAAAAVNPALQNQTAQAIISRLDKLESYERRAGRAASAAVAAGALADAAQTSRPFAGELAVLERLMPDSTQIAGLKPLAQTGAPTRAALAAEFPDIAARAVNAARASRHRVSFFERAFAAIGSLITLRRVDDVSSNSVDAIVARAEHRVQDGDVEGALEQMRALPPAGQAATADWRERAARRVEIEARIATLRNSALRDLADYAPPPEAAGAAK